MSSCRTPDQRFHRPGRRVRAGVICGACGAAALALSASAGAITPGPLAGYAVTTGAHTRAAATFTVPAATCGPGPSVVLIGTSIWQQGGGDVIAAVRVGCSGPAVVPTYTARAFEYINATIIARTLPLEVAPGQVIRTTAKAGATATATIADLTTHATKTAKFGPASTGQALIGMFCTANWNTATACTNSPKFVTVPFGNVLVDFQPPGTLSPTATLMVAGGHQIIPSALNVPGKGFVDAYK